MTISDERPLTVCLLLNWCLFFRRIVGMFTYTGCYFALEKQEVKYNDVERSIHVHSERVLKDI